MMPTMHRIVRGLRGGGAAVAALTFVVLVAAGCGDEEDGIEPLTTEQTTDPGVPAVPCDLDTRAQESARRLEKAGFTVLGVTDDEPEQPNASLAIALGEVDGSVQTTLFVFCDADAANEATRLAEMAGPGEVWGAAAQQTSVVLTKAPASEERAQAAAEIRDEVLEAVSAAGHRGG